MIRDVIERFRYRFELWQRERREYSGEQSSSKWNEPKKTLPGVLIFGIIFSVIGYITLHSGSFQYTPQGRATQIISPSTNPALYWSVSVGMLALGFFLSAYAVFCFVVAYRAEDAGAAQVRLPRFGITPMRLLMALLLISCVACIVSAITGIQAFDFDTRTGAVVAYWHGYWRLLALFCAAISALAFYGIYRRYPVAWKFGWVFLVGGAVECIVLVWLDVIHQRYGWVFAIAATLGFISVAVYWGSWWWKQKSYFFPDSKE
jgi:hypothetical protein